LPDGKETKKRKKRDYQQSVIAGFAGRNGL
jgi:hypothetical protein